MKAITVWQPSTTLLATGQKHNETRSWKTSYRGEIVIHAPKTDHSGNLLHIPMEELKHFQDAGVVNKLPTGAIIGKVNLVDCFQIDEAYRRKLQRENPAELAFGDTTMVCPNCESAAVINPYRKGRELYPHCPWCGQKLKEAEDETEKENQQAE